MFPQQNAPHPIQPDLISGRQSSQPRASVSSERSPLLTARSELLPAHHRDQSTSPSRSPTTNKSRNTWHETFTARSLKKKSSALSDRISGRNHSSANLWALGLGHHDESTEEEDDDEEDIVGDPGGFRKRKRNRKVKGAGYDGQFKAELEGEFGNGLRQVSIRHSPDPSYDPSPVLG